LARQILDVKVPEVRFGSAHCNREPEPKTRMIRAFLRKWLEQLTRFARRQATAFVAHIDQDAMFGNAGSERYVALRARELEGVLKKVRKRGRQELLIAIYFDVRFDGLNKKMDVMSLRMQRGARRHVLDEITDANRRENGDAGFQANLREGTFYEVAKV
jgi:hypothetical protein